MFIAEVQFASCTYDKGIKTFLGRIQNMPLADIYSQILIRLYAHQKYQLFKEIYTEAHDKGLTLFPEIEEFYQTITKQK